MIEKLTNLFKKKNDKKHVYLDKNTDYVFCFKRGMIIEDAHCEYHDYNVEMKNKKEYFKMTHFIGTTIGIGYENDPSPILNECDYCIKENENIKKYTLSYEARECLKEADDVLEEYL